MKLSRNTNSLKAAIVLTFAILGLMFQPVTNNQQKWCWTKSMVNSVGFVLDITKGGFNWSYCLTEEMSRSIKKTYSARVVTALTPRSTTESEVFIKMCGDKTCTKDWIKISSVGFDKQGVEQEVPDFEAEDVGQLETLNVRIQGSTEWRCKNIIIINDGTEFNFQCLQKLYPEFGKDQLEANVDGSTEYNVEIKTEDKKECQNKGPVHIQLFGDKKASPEKIFSDEVQVAGQLVESTIRIDEIGAIKGFKLFLLGEGKWCPVTVKIHSTSTGEDKIYNVKETLSYPGSSYTYKLLDPIEARNKDDEPEKEKSPISKPKNDEKKTEALNVHNPDGGLIEFQEKAGIIDLTCEQKLENTDQVNFGPSYPTHNVLYQNFLLRCPHNCHGLSSTVYGSGLHPDISPICLSALVDGAISLYGGIISLSVLPGRQKYDIPHDNMKLGDIMILGYGNALKSYSVAKVDNVDLLLKDYRILDKDGKLSNTGRPEIRIEGEWGTICNTGNDSRSAKLLCKDLGYKDGEWLGLDDEKYCGTVGNCGSTLARVHFSNISTTSNDLSFKTCNKNFADAVKCDHSNDAIINCFNENYENKPIIPDFVIRLQGVTELNELEKVGRLEMYKNGQFSPICKNNVNIQAVKLACTTMGFESGVIYDKDDVKEYRSNTTGPFSATDIKCDDNHKRIQDCKAVFTGITCNHVEDDLIVVCSGNDADITGTNQHQKKIQSNPPLLGKLGLPTVNLYCESKGSHKSLRGDPGSIYKVVCPANCEGMPFLLNGNGNYSNDSNVCAAAYQTGVLKKGGGSFIFIRTSYHKEYFGNMIYELESKGFLNKGEIPSPSFAISATNSGWENMNKIWINSAASPSSFIEESFDENLNENESNYKSILNSSFLALSMKAENDDLTPVPAFNFLEWDKNHVFSMNNNYVFPDSEIKTEKFTLIFRFNMQSFDGKAQTIFSYKGADGFNIYINRHAILSIGSLTDKKLNKLLDAIIPLNSWVFGYVAYKDGKLNYALKLAKGLNSTATGISANFEIPTKGRFGVGRQADVQDKIFNGQIEFVEVFLNFIDIDYLPTLIANARNRKQKNRQIREYTVDARECVSSCMDSVPGSGSVPPEAEMEKTQSADIDDLDKNGAIINGEKQEPLTPDKEKNGTNNSSIKEADNSTGGIVSPQDSKPVFLGGGGNIQNISNNDISKSKYVDRIELEEDTTLEDERFKNYQTIGLVLLVNCPKTDPKINNPVYGTVVFRASSSICRAALHQGIIKPMNSQSILLKVGPNKQAYNGSTGINDIVSQDVVETEKKLSFTITTAPEITKKVACTTTINSIKEETNNAKSLMLLCPTNCQNVNVDIFGGNESDDTCSDVVDLSAGNCIYSTDSSVCRAAIHCGVMNTFGGHIQVLVQGEHSKFIQQTSFGISSKERDGQVESFRFVGDRSAIFASYEEKYEGSIFDSWYPSTAKIEVENIKKNAWSYIKDENFTMNSNTGERILAITHKGEISCKLPLTAGSVIKKRNLDFANGEFKFNIISNSPGYIYVFFRYVDEDNHIGVLIDPSKGQGEFKLFAKVNSSMKILDSKPHPFSLKKWHRYTVKLRSDKIQFFAQDDLKREHKLVFESEFTQISRGTVAFGSSGNNLFFISGIVIKPFENKQTNIADDKMKFTWKKIISYAKDAKNQITLFCKQLSKKAHLTEVQKQFCATPRGFCEYQCGSILVKGYSVLKFNCMQECIKETKLSLNPLASISEVKDDEKIKEGEKCDFVESENKIYAAKVKSVSKGNPTLVSITYEDSIEGTKNASNLIFGKDIFVCGSRLRGRNDCKNTTQN